jgi:hypothetical protein
MRAEPMSMAEILCLWQGEIFVACGKAIFFACGKVIFFLRQMRYFFCNASAAHLTLPNE